MVTSNDKVMGGWNNVKSFGGGKVKNCNCLWKNSIVLMKITLSEKMEKYMFNIIKTRNFVVHYTPPFSSWWRLGAFRLLSPFPRFCCILSSNLRLFQSWFLIAFALIFNCFFVTFSQISNVSFRFEVLCAPTLNFCWGLEKYVSYRGLWLPLMPNCW